MPARKLTEEQAEALMQGLNDALAKLREARLSLDALVAEFESRQPAEEEG